MSTLLIGGEKSDLGLEPLQHLLGYLHPSQESQCWSSGSWAKESHFQEGSADRKNPQPPVLWKCARGDACNSCLT